MNHADVAAIQHALIMRDSDSIRRILSSFDALEAIPEFAKSTLLYEGARVRNKAVLQFLLARGVPPGLADSTGITALHLVAEKYDGAEVAQLLVDAGADLEARTTEGMTPLHHAAGHGAYAMVGTRPAIDVFSRMVVC